MPANRKPKAWNLKPQMTAAPELWRNCVILFAFWPGARSNASIRNLVDGVVFSPLTDDSGAIDGFALTEFGSAYHIDNGTSANSGKYYDLGTYLDRFSGGNGTLWAYTSPEFLSSNRESSADAAVWSTNQPTSSSKYWPYYNDNDQIQLWNSSSTGDTGLSFSAGEWFNHFVEFDGINATLFINGSENGSVSESDAFTDDLFLFTNTALDRSFAGHCLIAGAWTDINTERRKALENDPFAMLRPAGF